MTERERFEAWHLTRWHLVELGSEEELEKDENGRYVWSDVQDDWEGWLASREQTLRQLGASAKDFGLTVVVTATEAKLMKLGHIKAE